MSKGWISIHRKIRDHWLWDKNREFSKAEAWIDLLLHATHDTDTVNIGDKLFTVNRGEQIRSLKTLSSDWNWSRSRVKRFLDLLESDNMVRLKSETVTTRITICNYDTYQKPRNADETDVKRMRNASETHADTDNNVNNANNENNLSLSAENKVSAGKEKDKMLMSELAEEVFANGKNHPNLNEALACHIWHDINQLTPDNKKTLSAKYKNWVHPIRLMHERDKRDYREMYNIWKWVCSDPFWCKTILSTENFRDKFDQLKIKSQKSNANGKAKQTFDHLVSEESLKQWA